jgi:hypothetical protein
MTQYVIFNSLTFRKMDLVSEIVYVNIDVKLDLKKDLRIIILVMSV